MDSSGLLQFFESHVTVVVQWIRLCVETLGVSVIALGVAVGICYFGRAFARGATKDYSGSRLILARYLAVGLELQLGADILSTAIAPSWDQIGKPGAIAVIRTGLNYFLTREMETKEHGHSGSETS